MDPLGRGIVLIEESADIEKQAKRRGLAVKVADKWPLAYERTLFVGSKTKVPWDLLDAGFALLERWDVAVPLGTYGTLARDVGGDTERQATERRTRDLRMLLYDTGLLFARQNETAQELVSLWRDECINGADERLAFLRAVYQVKPRLCPLPRVWLMDVPAVDKPRREKRRVGSALIRVEVAPGRYVRCNPADVEKVKRMHQQGRRHR